MKPKFLYNPADAGGGGVAIAPTASEPVFLPQTEPGPLDADYQPKAKVQSGWQPEHPFEQPPEVAPEAQTEQPVAEPTLPPTAEPRVLTQNEHITVQITPDGKTIQFIENRTGRINTTVAATVDNMAMVLANDKSWQISQSMQQKELAQTQSQPTPPDLTQSEMYQIALEAAKEFFPQTDAEGRPYDLDPLAKALARFGEKLEGKQQAVTAQQQKFNSEISWVRSVDPSFDFNHPFVRSLVQENPSLTPREVYKEAVFWATMAERSASANGNGSQEAPAPRQAPEPRLQVPPEIYGKPGGSSPGVGPDARYEAHPEVMAAVANHDKYMRMAGYTPSDETRKQAKVDAIQILKSRQARLASGEKLYQ